METLFSPLFCSLGTPIITFRFLLFFGLLTSVFTDAGRPAAAQPKTSHPDGPDYQPLK